MAYSHILVGASTTPARPVILRLTGSDLFKALARGFDDFSAMPSHAVFLCVIYPLLGLLLMAMTLGYSMPLAFPLAAGLALLGPLAAIGLYELSRRREAGLDCSAAHALDVLHSRSLAAIMALGLLLVAIFLIWLTVAEAIYVANFGYAAPASIRQFADEVFTTPAALMVSVSTAKRNPPPIRRWRRGFPRRALPDAEVGDVAKAGESQTDRTKSSRSS
jgi:uncharacterized membrane protein